LILVAKNLAYNNLTIHNTAKNAICQYFKLVKLQKFLKNSQNNYSLHSINFKNKASFDTLRHIKLTAFQLPEHKNIVISIKAHPHLSTTGTTARSETLHNNSF